MPQFKAIPSFTASAITSLFITGSVPGCASTTGLTCVFGSAPNEILSPQKSLLLVRSWACTSNPITTSYLSLIMFGKNTCIKKRCQLLRLASVLKLCKKYYKLTVFNFLGILITKSISLPLRFAFKT